MVVSDSFGEVFDATVDGLAEDESDDVFEVNASLEIVLLYTYPPGEVVLGISG